MDDINMDEKRLSGLNGTDENSAEQQQTEDLNGEFEEIAIPIISDMDDAFEEEIAVPVISDMDDAFAEAVPEASEPAEPQPAADPQNSGEKPMSARERRMAEPFDMPGAYVPGEQNGPSKYVPKQNTSSEPQNPLPERRGNGDDFLDKMYAERQQDYRQGGQKAKILGIIVIVIAVFDFFSSISSKYSDNIDKIIAVATLAVMAYCAWKFIKGSNSCRATIGIFSAFDALRSIYAGIAVPNTIRLLNQLLDTEISAAPYVFMAIIKAIAFGAMAYFFLLDPQVSEYTKDD